MSKQSSDQPSPSPHSVSDEPTLLSAGNEGDSEYIRLRAMYEMLFERNPDGVVYSDSSGALTLNLAAQVLLGTAPPVNQGGVESWQQTYGVFLADGKTPHPSETMPLALALMKRETIRDYECVIKNAANPEGVVINVTAAPLPNRHAICVLRDVTDRKRLEADLARRNEELKHQVSENNSLIERLRLAVDELSTPVLELADDILALPVVGIVDTVRSARMMEKILAEVVSRRCRAVIMDVTGVDVIDTSTADRFIRIARSIELLGAECVICGVQPAVSQTLTDLGVSFHGLSMQRNLKRALDLCVMRLQQSRRNRTS